ncbi:hypothetical protein EMIHUDRAFT_77021 [Emiliania huxleyi CCMP1516]|uniref:Dynein heavy chain C-terminal domain-containing protein n=4 Tax=Emiliania huxleyi TaxID=2903 RepID=A0A0D3IF90_EMIH1|nr:hypothetical protein EMIHUDRAFT_77021 [Emiliania huxleyi CCMP1516]EOD09925.1 hypothetical protein EMIHUDRAFT_77021 [Emiliania huxleyi CCMP1516]|eukprot:XP_005762354.1 hypothetical protein EMIHUDRAFT_77021 [Emiliania huxleyi CCMP1516]
MHTFEGDACPSVSTPPEDGAYIYGLFIEGARWDADVQLLQESEAKVLFTQLPVVHMLPEQHRKPPSEGVYACPIYKTLARFGTLSTTGHSTNFVMVLDIPCSLDQPQPHWVKRGVAGLLSLNF